MLNPCNHLARPASDFADRNDWQTHNGIWQPVPDEQLVKVMYSNGYTADTVRCAYAWTHWTGGRNWWVKPADDRLYIMAYVVI